MLLPCIKGGIRSGKEAIIWSEEEKKGEREMWGTRGRNYRTREKGGGGGDTYVKGGKRKRVFIELGG